MHKYVLNNARKICLICCLAMRRYPKSDVRSAKAFVCERCVNPPEAPLTQLIALPSAVA